MVFKKQIMYLSLAVDFNHKIGHQLKLLDYSREGH